MAAITKIEIEGFKAFPNYFELNLEDGKNLLLYGENGSGKSSVYFALHVLLQSAFKEDGGAKYFMVEDARKEHLINLYREDELPRPGGRARDTRGSGKMRHSRHAYAR